MAIEYGLLVKVDCRTAIDCHRMRHCGSRGGNWGQASLARSPHPAPVPGRLAERTELPQFSTITAVKHDREILVVPAKRKAVLQFTFYSNRCLKPL